ncbi:unnamed protein product [Rangifer tarandus platyrhynchus]|uniref:Uncharacterized protein n=2 Tax=Rangifer tarandus platyrhynchus TaxID=3082113 RepID=A0AC59YSK0_RANTA|nr:unnamed protein product [Rangifer tarandus platyrhynchus]
MKLAKPRYKLSVILTTPCQLDITAPPFYRFKKKKLKLRETNDSCLKFYTFQMLEQRLKCRFMSLKPTSFHHGYNKSQVEFTFKTLRQHTRQPASSVSDGNCAKTQRCNCSLY